MTEIEQASIEWAMMKIGLFPESKSRDDQKAAEIMVSAYREQQAELKQLKKAMAESCLEQRYELAGCERAEKAEARIKEMQLENGEWKQQVELLEGFLREEKSQNDKAISRIAALEGVLKFMADFSPHCCEDCPCDEFRRMANEALSGSKLGELFQALLEEHEEIKNINPKGVKSWIFEKVEAMIKEVGL